MAEKMVTILNVEDIKIPTIDYSMLLSDNLEYLGHACEDFGFFNLVNHGVPDDVFEAVFRGISDFFKPASIEDRKEYEKKSPIDKLRWVLRSSLGENRENFKLAGHPQFYCPTKPSGFSEAMEEYVKRLRVITEGLGKAISKAMGFEECYIEKALELDSGFDVSSLNLYPPNFKSKGSTGIAEHTDPGFLVSLIQDVNGGLQIPTHNGKWINVYIPPNAILFQCGDQLEVRRLGV